MSFSVFVKHEYIKPGLVEEREYQKNIAYTAQKSSTLVVIPTGLGKTVIALVVIAEQLKKKIDKILFLSPTKPLVNQHALFLKKHLNINQGIEVFTGDIPPSKRKSMWESAKIIISTPQVVENDLISKRIDLDDISLIVYDEVHRAVGNYAYVFIAEMYKKQRNSRLSLGMTASPGNDISKILQICKTLEIENIEIRTKYDPDVIPYVHDLKFQWKEVDLPKQFSFTIQFLRRALSNRIKKLKDMGFIESSSLSTINRKKILDIQKRIQEQIRLTDNPPKMFFQAASLQNASLKLYHAIELMQTQGVHALLNYFQRMGDEAGLKTGSKASKSIMNDADVLEALAYAKSIEIEHPKIPVLCEIVSKQFQDNKDSKIIIFTNYRYTASYVLSQLQNIDSVRPIRFIGQAGRMGDKGLTQKEQIDIIENFKSGVYNVLIATSVAEEGLDIPSTDLVIFYEPVPSEIRSIQRRGRTARKKAGKVIILIAKSTPDEGYYWSSRRKERMMRSELEVLRSSLHHNFENAKSFYQKVVKEDTQRSLKEYSNSSSVVITVDYRESRSSISRYLSQKDITINTQQLDIGDYILSSRIGVERKQVDDFLNSLLEGKLFMQMRNLRSAYSRPLLIVEGDGLFTKRNINHNAIFGSFVSIIVDFGIPIITTANAHETADFLIVMAKREQKQEGKSVAIRGEKWSMSEQERQQFIIEGLPNISAVLAQRLLQHFGSIRAIANASVDELCEVKGIGKNIAEEIVKIFNMDYITT
ncbi:MAG: DEAD/DEAH box helicase [Thermoplasmatota archaeon]